MKRLLFLLIVLCESTILFAQQLTIKTVSLRPGDARARTNPRDDANGKKCAIIRVGVVGVENLVFPDAVGNVERSLSEYVVYVPEGLKSLKCKTKEGAILSEIIFDDWDMEINSLASYEVVIESDSHLRSAIFSIQPKNAQLVFNGEKIKVDADGMAMINKPVGEYSYQVTAKGFESQSGTVTLTEDDISTVTNVVLQEILYPVNINVFPEDATVFIDNVPYSKEARVDLQLAGGKHSIRVTATNYEDDERTIEVKNGLTPLYFALKENKQKVVKHKEERTRTSVNVRTSVYPLLGVEAELYDKNKYDAHKWGIKWHILSLIHHFGGIFGVREGVSIGWMYLDKDMKYDKIENVSDSTNTTFFVEVPLQVGLSIPFGKYNKHLFSVLGGGYGKVYFLPLKDEKNLDKDSHKTSWDYGLRLTAQLDISKFSFGADVSNSLNGKGVFFSVRFSAKF